MNKPTRPFRLVWLAVALPLLGCQGPEDPAASVAPGTTGPVVVYAAYKDNSYLPGLLAEFTEQTGIVVTVRTGKSDALVNDVIENKINPPADLLLTHDVYGVWLAAEEGALRPLQSAVVTSRIAPWLRDADGFWTALSYRTAQIIYDPAKVDVEELDGPQALAAPRFKGELCLAKMQNSISLAVIAQWIDTLGGRETELLVRGWVSNLAVPAFSDEVDVLEAIVAGRCSVGLVSMDTYAQVAAAPMQDFSFGNISGPDIYADIEAIGIARHARNPEGGRALVEWLLSDAAEHPLLDYVLAHDATTKMWDAENVSVVAVYREDAIKLAERARYP